MPGKTLDVWWAVLKAIALQIEQRNLPLIAAGVAFFSLLSLFPTITALVSIWSVFADPAELNDQLGGLEQIAPEDAYRLIEAQLQRLASAPPTALSWTGALALLLGLWSARAAVGALTRGLNTVYGEANRKGLRHLATMMVLTVALLVTSAVFIALLVILPVALSFLPLGSNAEAAIRIAKWLVMVAMLIGMLGLIYRRAPNRRAARIPWVSPGAIVATAIWIITSAAFTVYLENFGNYNEVYGSLGAMIALLIWFFITALAVLLGGAMNAELERHTKIDSTVGRPRPLGQRGATAADTYLPVK